MYDFIIVGAGASGCALAWRLVSLPERPQVLLIEAGDINDDMSLRVDGDRWISRMNPSQNWGYRTEPQEGLDGMVIDYDRGKGLGGSTAINFCCYTIGPSGDYDRLARLVDDEDFSWCKVSDIFRQLETFHMEPENLPGSASKYIKPNMKIRGHDGPLNVGFARKWEQTVTDMIDICEQAGLGVNYDMNGGNPIGVGVTPQTATNGARRTAADLLPRSCSNLSIRTKQQILRLTFDGLRCTGVQTEAETFHAKKEVILCCGSLDSPKILLHSGIGPSEQLRKFGIDTLVDLPGVGQNLRDHHHVFLTWERADHTTQRRAYYQNSEAQSQARQQWLDDRTGPLSEIGTTLAMGWLKNQEVLKSSEFMALPHDQQNHLMHPTVPHFEIALNPATADYFINPQGAPALFTAGVFVLNTESRGTCELQSADPSVPLKFDPRFFTHPFDRRVAIEATRALLKLAQQPQFVKDTISLWSGPASDSEEDILAFWRKATMSTWHMSGTVAMGASGETNACVDSGFKVIGVKGLRVADMSAVPVIMNCHVQSVAYCIGGIAADKIAREHYASSNV